MIDYADAYAASLEYFNEDELAANIFLGKYALKTPSGELLESIPPTMHRRLAKEFARIEANYPNPLTEDEIFTFFDRFGKIVPQGSPMAGIGNPYQNMSISNCFVIPAPFDSYGGILLTDQQQAQIMKRRGGVGFDISTIRPKGLNTANAAKTTDGIGIFMDRYSNTCREVAQGGRRGALMLSISVHHPEIETFIHIKQDRTRVTGANISIRVTDEFMDAVKNNTDYALRFPVDAEIPDTIEFVSARKVWDQIVEAAHASAEPGILFWDTVERRTPADAYPDFHSVSTNPCGEITLSEYDSCRLLLVNLMGFVKNPFTPESSFDHDGYAHACYIAQRLMDDMVDLEIECIDRIIEKIQSDPEPYYIKDIEINLWGKIRAACVDGRRTGTGVTAVGDAIAALGVKYGSDESIDLVGTFYKELAMNAYRSTVDMAAQRGTFPAYNYKLEKDHEFIRQIMNEDPELAEKWRKFGRRNIALTTTAPAGTVSIMTQTTSGIEPAIYISYFRKKKIHLGDKQTVPDFIDELGDRWVEFPVYHHGYQMWMDVTGDTNPENSPYYGATANDIDWLNKVKMQAAAQKWVCHAISNTTNLPKDVSIDTVKDLYMTAWETGCKGITIYREGSRDGVLTSTSVKDVQPVFDVHHAPKRPAVLHADVHNMTVLGEKWTFFIGIYEDRPYEIMGGLSKYVAIPKRVKYGEIHKHNGPTMPVARYDFHYDVDKGEDDEVTVKDISNSFDNATYMAFTRTLSLALRHGTPVQYVVEQLQKGSEKEDDLFSFSKAASRVLKQYIEDGLKAHGVKCLDCGADEIFYQEGCMICKSCGNSKCG